MPYLSRGRNVAVEGRVVDETGRPLPGLLVSAHDTDAASRDDALGWARTDDAGRYRVRYPTTAYGRLEAAPDLVVTVRDAAGIRVLARSPVHEDVRDEVLRLPDQRLPLGVLDGWVATLGGRDASRLTHGNAVEFLVDGEAAFAALLDAIRRAEGSLTLLQLLFKADFRASFDERTERTGRLADALVEADARGVRVRVLMNENLAVRDDVDEVKAFFARAGSEVVVRGAPSAFNVMHAKLLLVDGEEAIVIDPPLEQRFWDTRDHPLEDEARRGPGQPIHCVSARLRGPCVRDVAEAVNRLWGEMVEDAPPPRVPAVPAPAGRETVQVTLTLPRESAAGAPGGETGILESYERALAAARDFVFVETQYFTSETFTESLRAALEANRGLQAIVLLNEHVDIPLYDRWQDARLERLGVPDHPRLGVYSLWTPGWRDGRFRVRPVYVHSKTGIADDAWATVGSANLDGISLDRATEFGRDDERNVDLNLALLDGVDGHPATGAVARFRRDLWAEHLGIPADALARRPADGWLALFREAAEANLRALRAGEREMRGRLLPVHPDLPKGLAIPPPLLPG